MTAFLSKVTDLTKQPFLSPEMVLIKVSTSKGKRSEIVELAYLFKGQIVSVQPDSVVIQKVDDHEVIDNLLEMLRPYGIMDVTRSGVIAMSKE